MAIQKANRNKKRLYEGKAKILYRGTEPGTVIQHFKDDLTAFNQQKVGVAAGKGELNNRISAYLFSLLDQIKIPHHFIRRLGPREQLVKMVDIIPIEVVIRNVSTGSMAKRLGVADGLELPCALVEFCLKSDDLSDPIVSAEHIACFGWAQPHELDEMTTHALRINDFFSGLFRAIGIRLVDIKLEFGRWRSSEDMQLLLADEISPDTMRLWEYQSNRSLDKDLFRFDRGDLVSGYAEVARRLEVDSKLFVVKD